MEMKAGMKYETEIVVNEGMLANHNDPQLPARSIKNRSVLSRKS